MAHRSMRLPYTTLFRSAADTAGVRSSSVTSFPLTDTYTVLSLTFIWSDSYVRSPATARESLGLRPFSHTADRKSTRLNSSHRTISYAVFCCKKQTDQHL